MLFYIHGFNSSPASFKAKVLHERLAARGRAHEFAAPALPPAPAAAAIVLETLTLKHPHAALVGSSLGGYYATWLAERCNLRAVLVNPAVRPYELLAGHVGRQKNFHSGEEYDFTLEHVAELRALEVATITPANYFLMVETGDEVLDYRRAVARYRGGRQLIVEGGDHGFTDFAQYADAALDFCDGRSG
ncbi:MAG TPA: YqiA/YcfP family alpha/beta fold hydrolase [Burkholderiales bacterium]|nr:YqiA/YcfP family alpha/beta fold hydrolase [Burkholderiales bacterium]